MLQALPQHVINRIITCYWLSAAATTLPARPRCNRLPPRDDPHLLPRLRDVQNAAIEWLLTTCTTNKGKVDAILDPAAVDLLASRLRTPLQIEQHLTLALETGYQASEKPVGESIVDSVLSKQIDDLEPTLTRHGYTAKMLTEMLGAKLGEIKALFKQTLEADRARELKEQMLAAGLPV